MKRSTRTKVNRGVLYAVLVVALGLVILLADWAAIRENFLDVEVLKTLWPEIVTVAAKNTIIYTVIAFAGGLVIALFLALMKLSPVAPYRWIATSYIEFFRGLPALVVIIGFGFAVPIAFGWRPPGGTIGAGIIALIVVSGAYMAETIRAGIQAVPKGQTEAARSLGMSSSWTTVSVVLPQAFRIVIPPLTNEFVILIKDTSLIFVLGVILGEEELFGVGQAGYSDTFNATYFVGTALGYLAVTLPLIGIVNAAERRLRSGLVSIAGAA